MKNIVSFIIISILAMMSVYGSYYNFEIEPNIVTSTVDSEIGNIVISKSNIVSQNYEIATVQPLSINRQDRIIWRGDTELEISNNQGLITVLQKDDQYMFNQLGTFFISQNGQTQTVTVTSVPELQGQLSIDSDLDFVYDKTSFTIESSRFFEVSLANYTQKKGNFEYVISFKSNEITKNVTRNINIGSIQLWNVTNNSVSNVSQVKAGDLISIGVIEIENRGNENFAINVEKQGDIVNYMNIPTKIDTFQNTKSYLNVLVQIPSAEDDKTLVGSLKLTSATQEFIIPIQIEIMDLIPPEIRDITFEHDKLKRQNEIRILAFDNVGVEKVIMSYNVSNQTYNATFEKDQQLFVYTTSFDVLDMYEFTFCAYDKSDNLFCTHKNKTFHPLEPITRENRVDGKTVRTNTWNKIHILNITEDVFGGVELKFNRFLDNNNNDLSQYTIRIVDEFNNVQPLNNINETVILQKGNVYVEVRGEEISNWELHFSLITDYFIQDYNPFIVTGKIGTYSSPSEFKSNFGSQMVECYPYDTGVEEDSYYECLTQLPITTDLNNVLIPVSVQEKRFLEDQIQTLKSEKTVLSAQYFGIFSLLFIVILLLMFGVFVYNYIYPRMLIFRGKRND